MSATAEFAPALATAPTSRRERAFLVVRILLGCLLLTAAGLKLYGLNVTAIPRVGWFATPRVQVAAIAWEMVLGFWLLSGANRAWSWVAALGTFVGFAGISGYFGWIGVANCSCFGVIKASPWTAFGLDAAVMLLLAATRPEFGWGALRLPAGLWSLAAGALAVLIGLAGIGWLAYGSPQLALTRMQGAALVVSPEHVDFGSGTPGQTTERVIFVRNWTDQPVRLIGGTAECSCMTTADLPLTIRPGESQRLVITMRIPDATVGAFTRTAVLDTDCDRCRTIRFQVGCSVVE